MVNFLNHLYLKPQINTQFFSKISFSTKPNMKILAWNILGLGNKFSRDHLKNCIFNYNPDIIFLSETKSTIEKASFILRQMKYPNVWCNEDRIRVGGLALLWKDGMNLEFIHSSKFMVNVIITNPEANKEWFLTCIYSSTYDNDRQVQWSFIQEMGRNMSMPWVIMGDFNSTLYSYERQSYSINPTQSHPIVVNTITSLGLMDIPFIGCPFTWSSHRDQLNQVRTRLDRVVCLPNWMYLHPNATLKNLISSGSDHASIFLITNPQSEKLSKPYRFYEHWLANKTCKEEIKRRWSSNAQGTEAFKFTSKVRSVKKGLKEWKIKEYGDTYRKIKEAQDQIQQCLNQQIIDNQEHQRLQQQLKNLYEIKNRIAYQQSRESTIKFQDRNSKSFHAQANYRRRCNQIEACSMEKH